MKTLILTLCMLFGLVALAETGTSSASEDPNLRRGFDGASTFLDPTNVDCKPCMELLKSRQNLSRDVSGSYSPQSLGRVTPNQPNVKPGLIRNPGVKTGQ